MQENKLSAVCEKVFDRCLAPTAGGEGCDNMTMILIQFKNIPTSDASVTDQPEPSAQPNPNPPAPDTSAQSSEAEQKVESK
jgi:protein phosphatase 1G